MPTLNGRVSTARNVCFENSLQITLQNKKHSFVQCKPLMTGQMLYWLDAETTLINAQVIDTPDVYKIDYDLMHHHLGHSSKKVLRGAKEHTKGFPDGIIIPSMVQCA